ncbi:hypothetical protein F0U61_20795 [Archangium violaceum]|uniref:hypothetical protein n=1 Tax=Archangium violaceum TaxID=83451 RepID=UPI002B2AE94F|nr:hypothetical protein F0U61_20795 [Archangium violaceum]
MRRNILLSTLVLGFPLMSAVACGPDATVDTSQMVSAEDIGTDTASLQSCNATSAQPAGCSYGDFCTVSGSCQAVPAPACTNFELPGASWNPNSSTGPIIYQAAQIRFGPDSLWCPSSEYSKWERITIRLRAYSMSRDLPKTVGEFHNRFYYVTADGRVLQGSGLINNIMTSADGQTTTFDTNFCMPLGTTRFSAGFFFTDGNEYCALATK